jgi:hypothetical protein
MNNQQLDSIERAADFLQEGQPELANQLRSIVERINIGTCIRCDEPFGRRHAKLYATFSTFDIAIELKMPEDALLCDDCIRHYLDKLPSKLLKS